MYQGGVKKNDFGHDIYDGKGILFDQDGERLFEGEFVNHMKQGNGIMYLKGQLIYQGEFIQNKNKVMAFYIRTVPFIMKVISGMI